MKARKRTVNMVSIERATNTAKEHAENYLSMVERFQSDADKKNRLEECKCKSCYYFFKSRIGGAAMTSVNCGICDKETIFGSTAVEPICKSCGAENGLCIQCGGDLDMKVRRKPYPFQLAKVSVQNES